MVILSRLVRGAVVMREAYGSVLVWVVALVMLAGCAAAYAQFGPLNGTASVLTCLVAVWLWGEADEAEPTEFNAGYDPLRYVRKDGP